MNKKIYIPPVTLSVPMDMASTILAGSQVQGPDAESKGHDFFDDEEELGSENAWGSQDRADGWRDAYNPW